MRDNTGRKILAIPMSLEPRNHSMQVEFLGWEQNKLPSRQSLAARAEATFLRDDDLWGRAAKRAIINRMFISQPKEIHKTWFTWRMEPSDSGPSNYQKGEKNTMDIPTKGLHTAVINHTNAIGEPQEGTNLKPRIAKPIRNSLAKIELHITSNTYSWQTKTLWNPITK